VAGYDRSARADKRLERIRQHPRAVRPDELDAALQGAGFAARQHGTNHKVYSKGDATLSVPQHRPHLGEHYVKRALELLEEEGVD
jgi:hypothetical protein